MPPRILCVVGPTACGKTRFSIELAKRYHGEVVSIDSMQIYKGMSIGTAAPTAEEMAAVPHHMVAVADPGEDWSAARFAEAADRCIQDILSRNRLPILAGGTGLYLDAVVAGRQFAPGSSGGAVRRELEAELAARGPAHMLERLREADPLSAGRLHPADTKRILRALEVYLETGETISQHDRRTRDLPKRYDPVYLGLAFRDREDMKRLIDRRVDQMMAQGLEGEVRALLESGIPPDCTAMQAIGYKELAAAIRSGLPVQSGAEEVKLRSRQYAKRQLTWFRRNRDARWFEWEKIPDFSAALSFSTELIREAGLQ